MRIFICRIVQFIFYFFDISFQGNYFSGYKIRKQFKEVSQKPLRILGNGSSLDLTMDYSNSNYDYLVVNRHILSDSYSVIKPKHYVLADPFFFTNQQGIEIINKINANTNWKMYLWVPHKYSAKQITKSFIDNNHIAIIEYNANNFDGYGKLSYLLYDNQLAMPKIQNVIVAAIMIGILSNYSSIELYGVEHDWLKWLYVGEDNRIYLKDSHFFDTTEVKPNAMKRLDGSFYSLYSIMNDYAAMFESYKIISDYLSIKHPQVQVVNMTPNSYIDAFPRAYSKQQNKS